MRCRQLSLLALAPVTSLTVTSAAHASRRPGPATDIVQYGWNIKDWSHFGPARLMAMVNGR